MKAARLTKQDRLKKADAKRERHHQKLIQIVKENYALVQKGRLACGKALIEIRDDGYWQDTHTSFKDYCAATFDISESYAHRLMDGINTINTLPEKLQSRISNEAQTRALSNVPEEDRASVVKAASKNGHVTAKSIEEAASEIEEKRNTQNLPIGKLPVSVKSGSKTASKDLKEYRNGGFDEIGIPVPDEALPFWVRYDEVKGLMDMISHVKCKVEGAKLKNDFLYGGVSNNVVVDMKAAYGQLKDGALPYAVCTQCQGSPSMQQTGCSFCRNTGLISEWRWNTQAISEVKEMRIKIAAELKSKKD